MKKYSIISLFAGCGGMDLGFRGGFRFLNKNYTRRNFDIIWANDNNENACITYKNYFGSHIVCDDITNILNGEGQKSFFKKPLPQKANVVIGGFPCQDFSHAGKRLGFGSKRGLLYQSMVEVVKKTKPLIFVAENVKGLLSMNKGEAIKTIIKDFEKLGYHVVPKLYLAADYAVPQMRERVLIVGSLKSELPPFKHPKPKLTKEKYISIEEAIGDLQNTKEGSFVNHFWSKAKKNNGQGNNKVSKNKPGPTMRAEHHGNIEFHWNNKRRLSAREAARIQSFPDDFIFYPSTSAAYKQIGNAVPPVLIWNIATVIEKFLKKYHNNLCPNI